MIRVLHSVSNMARAGIETFLMNYYREMDRDQIQFDFLANKPAPGEYDQEIRSMGGRVFISPGLNPLNFPRYEHFMSDLLRREPDIRIVHSHNGALGYYALRSARDAGVRIRVAHAHNTRIPRDAFGESMERLAVNADNHGDSARQVIAGYILVTFHPVAERIFVQIKPS